MMVLRKFLTAAVVASLYMGGFCASAGSRGGFMANQERQDAATVDGLPAEIRAEVRKWEAACGRPLLATRSLTRFIEVSNDRFIALHFHALSCRNGSAICGEAGCLHEVYASKDGRYRRVMSLHVQDITLKRVSGDAAVEIDCAFAGCPQLLWWNGNRFVKR